MNRKVAFAPGEYYHAYNRGVDKRTIFKDQGDYQRFLALMYLCNTKESLRVPSNIAFHPHDAFSMPRSSTLVDICAYCLMPNHFHILLYEKQDKGISLFMQKLSTAYSMYFNIRNERSGTLFQGVFKAQHVPEDRYMRYLIAYLHLNPVKLIEPKWKEEGIRDRKKAEHYMSSYPFSSFQDFYGIQRPENAILSPGSLPKYFSTPTNFKESMQEWLTFPANSLQGETL